MPGFDRTGPRGMGPMTGRGMGFCDPANNYEGVTNYSTYGAVYNRPSYSTYGTYYYGRRVCAMVVVVEVLAKAITLGKFR